MEKCTFCGAEAALYHLGVPICPKCAEGYRRLVQESPTNDHERAIANIIEARCERNECSYYDGLLEITETVEFSITDADFRYAVAVLKKNCLKPEDLKRSG